MKFIPSLIAAFPWTFVITVHAEIFGGIDFPQGAVSFADRVVSYTPGTPGPTGSLFIRPIDSLGPPDYPGGNDQPGSVSLGVGGTIVLEFTNNFLTGSNSTAADLHIFEVGTDVEDTFAEISVDGITWFAVGKVSGSTSSIDIDAFGFTAANQFRFVRLRDDPAEGQTSGDSVGADIDAVGAIASNLVDDNPVLTIRDAGNTAYADLIELQAPVAYWKLNEASGSHAKNFGLLGNPANGTYGSTAYPNAVGLRSGSQDTALELPYKNINSRMLVTEFAMPTGAVTVSFLIRGQDDGESFFFGYGSSATSNEFTMGANNGNFRSVVRGSIADHSGVDVLDANIHHVALTWTGTGGLLQIYVDGVPVASRTVGSGSSLTSGGVLSIGQDLDSLTPPNYGFEASQALVGTVDEFAVFNRVLAASEIQDQYEASVSAPSEITEFFLEFQSAFGSAYTIRNSPDLTSWTNLVTAVPGTGGLLRFPVKKDQPKQFFQLE